MVSFLFSGNHEMTISTLRRLNFSDWNGALNAGTLQKAIQDNMPPPQFTLFHRFTRRG